MERAKCQSGGGGWHAALGFLRRDSPRDRGTEEGTQLTQRSRISVLGLEASCFSVDPISHREMKSMAWKREREIRSSSSQEVF